MMIMLWAIKPTLPVKHFMNKPNIFTEFCPLWIGQNALSFHPRLQQNYTGPDMTPRWNIVFWSFLTKTWKVWAFLGRVYGQKTLYALQLAL